MNTYSINATSKCKIFYVVYINNIIYLYITFNKSPISNNSINREYL